MEELLSIIDKGIRNFKDFKKKDLLRVRELFFEEMKKNGIFVQVQLLEPKKE